MTKVAYFNSHSSRLAFWRLGYRNKLRREMTAKRNARHKPVVQSEIAKCSLNVDDLLTEMLTHISDLNDRIEFASPMLAAMMQVKVRTLQRKVEQLLAYDVQA